MYHRIFITLLNTSNCIDDDLYSLEIPSKMSKLAFFWNILDYRDSHCDEWRG
jgi:hypothetical protein